jgi:Outer membrane protein beta-barrel domain
MLLMRKLIGIFAFLAVCAAPATAQGVQRFDFSAGGSFRVFQQTFTADEAKVGMPGWYASGDYNIHKFRNHFGLEMEGSGNYRNLITLGSTSIYTLLVGPKIYPFGHHKLTPFGHVLFGGGYYRDAVPPQTNFPHHIYEYGSGVWEGGAGLDLNVRKHWGVRVIEFDYAQTRFPVFGPYASEGNYKVSIGINYRFGAK